jgi:hypothetical protein
VNALDAADQGSKCSALTGCTPPQKTYVHSVCYLTGRGKHGTGGLGLAQHALLRRRAWVARWTGTECQVVACTLYTVHCTLYTVYVGAEYEGRAWRGVYIPSPGPSPEPSPSPSPEPDGGPSPEPFMQAIRTAQAWFALHTSGSGPESPVAA